MLKEGQQLMNLLKNVKQIAFEMKKRERKREKKKETALGATRSLRRLFPRRIVSELFRGRHS